MPKGEPLVAWPLLGRHTHGRHRRGVVDQTRPAQTTRTRTRALMTREAAFTVYPAIDLRGGKCVRLKQGDFGRSKEYDADPIERAREWERQGAEVIHVVDLDGAERGRPVQLDLIERMARSVKVPLQVGGGIRTLKDLHAARESGAQRVVIGTAAVGD